LKKKLEGCATRRMAPCSGGREMAKPRGCRGEASHQGREGTEG